MARTKKCPPGRHTDQVMRGGKRIRCTTCKDEFPCSYACDHCDCRDVRGEPLPEGVSTKEPPVTLAECINV